MNIDDKSKKILNRLPKAIQSIKAIANQIPDTLKRLENKKYSTEQNKVYLLPGSSQRSSVVLFFCGGGFYLGPSKSAIDACFKLHASIKDTTDIAIVSYPLAPAYRFPESIIITDRFLQNLIPKLKQHYSNIFFCGESSGGNLCAAILANNAIQADGLILLTPSLDYFNQDYSSKSSSNDDLYPNKEIRSFFADQYVPSNVAKSDPLISPILSESLHHLPPTLIVSAGNDPFRDEANAFYEKLTALDVKSEIVEFQETIHNFFSYQIEPHFSKVVKRITQFINTL